MKNQNLKNRIWIIFNLASSILLLLFFNLGKSNNWQISFIVANISFALIFILSFYLGFMKTKFWKMVHIKSKYLDERELNVVLRALKYAYSIFTITCIGLIYIFTFIHIQQFDVLFASGLLYLAHILPAAIVGWNEIIFENNV